MSPRWRSRLGLCVAASLSALIAATVVWGTSDETLRATIRGEEYEALTPTLLVVVAVVPFLFWGLSRSLADLPRAQRWLSAFLRTGLIITLAFALARVARTTDTTLVSTVFLVDVSDSVSESSIDRAREVVSEAYRARGDNDVQLVTFAAEARVETLSENASRPLLERHQDSEERGTNLASALQLAYGLFPSGHLRRAVLLSDGVQTEGDLLAEASRAAEFEVRLFAHPYVDESPREVAVTRIETPTRPRVGQPFALRAHIFATEPTSARVRLFMGETLNGLDGVRDVELEAGDNELSFRSVARVAGPVTYSLDVEPEGDDRFTANNRYATTVVVPGRPTVLYVEGATARATYLASALSAGDFEVDVRSARAIPTSLRELERYDFFILSDVSADQVSLTAQDAIERYVRDLGGGFMMAGGENSFGLGGWQGTRIERLLPVRMDAERRRDQPTLAIALVIDKSGSMNGPKMELAKEAAIATAEMLGPDDYIEVVGFDSRPTRIVSMQSARNRLRITRDIGRLTARGGTAIFPALDVAFQDLMVTRARVKHVILLTDGQTRETGIPTLVTAMNAEGITVSTVGLGAEVNRALLQQAASLGGGRSYFTNDPHNIPRIFMRETSTVARSNVVEEFFQPRVTQPADFLRGVPLVSAPYLHGYVATRAKPSPAQTILSSDLGEPILARWRVGLGWSLAWTSDVKNRWAVEWLRWPGFSRFFSQLVREHMRQRRRQELDMTAEVVGGEVRVTVDAIGADDGFLNGLESTVHVEGPLGRTPTRRHAVERDESLRQTAPGRYEARFSMDAYGSFVLTAEHRREGLIVAESSAQLVNPYPREYAILEPDEALLRRAVELTAGRMTPTAAELFDPGTERIEAREELWPRLVFIALFLFVIDLLLRRVRLFDRSFRAPVGRRS